MRHFTIAAGLALATMFAIAPAMAESGGVKEQNGQCRLFNGNSNNLAYSYWGACPNAEPTKKGATHTVHVASKHKKG